MKKNIERFIQILVGVSFFVPLIILSENFIFPFIVPKIIVFRILVLLMLGSYILLLYNNWQKYRVRMIPITWTVLLFLASWAISTFTGVDWYRSMWDGHERMLGFFTIIHYVLYFLILTTVVRTQKEWKTLMRVFLGAGSMVMLIGVVQQYINLEAFLNKGADRVSATLGNPIYLSGYGLFLLFLGSYLAVKDYVAVKKWQQTFWFWYAMIGGLLGFWGIFLGGTRGTLLGLLVALGVGAVLYIITIREQEKLKYTMMGIIALGIILLGLAFTFRNTQFVQSIPAVGRVVNISLTEGTGETRLMAWGIAVEAWQTMPLFGWGPNNYYYAFNEYYNPKFLEHGWGETWFDNAHSVIFNTLAVQGIIGLVLYIGLFGVPIVVLWRAYRKQIIDVHTFILPTAFLIGHFVHNAFVFENPTSYLYFFFILALVNIKSFPTPVGTSSADSVISKKSKRISGSIIAGVTIPIVLIIWTTNVNPARANMVTLDFLLTINTGRPSMELYYQAVSYGSPHNDDIRNDFARSFSQISEQYIKNGLTKQVEDISLIALDELEKNKMLHPMDIRIHLQQSQLIQGLAVVTQNVEWVIRRELLLEKALEFSPKRQQVLYSLASTKQMLGKNDEAIILLEQAWTDNKIIVENWKRLLDIYLATQNEEKANDLLEEASQRGINIQL